MTTLPNNKKIVILGGGTNTYVSNHLALSAPAYGSTAITLEDKFRNHPENKMDVNLYLTKMAHPDCKDAPDTPEDIEILVDQLVADPDTRVIIFNVAMVDFKPEILHTNLGITNTKETIEDFGKYNRRLSSSSSVILGLSPYQKVINKIRKERKDILLVGFKTTCGATKEEQFQKGLKLCKDASANIVFVNDVDKERIEKLDKALSLPRNSRNLYEFLQDKSFIGDTGHDYMTNSVQYLERQSKHLIESNTKAINTLQNNGLVTPEESSYWYNTRDEALDALVQMVLDRSHLHFTRSTVVDSETVPWLLGTVPNQIYNPLIPSSFYIVFDHLRRHGAYKKGPTGATVGHFGISLGPNEFLTSKRKTDFNKIEEVGLVRVITDDPDDVFGYKHFFEESNRDKVVAFGAKPSVGGQSQRSLFNTFPDLNCIVHFHCPLKSEYRNEFKPVEQFSFECGSAGCIKNNLSSFHEFKVSETHSIWAGHMDHHGPNIVFNKSIDPQLVIDFINEHWDLSRKTDGLSKSNI